MILSKTINKFPKNLTLVITSLKKLSRDDCIKFNKKVRNKVNGLRIALFLTDPIKVVLSLIALDGEAKAIILISSSLDYKNAVEQAIASKAELILCDNLKIKKNFDKMYNSPPTYLNLKDLKKLKKNKFKRFKTEWILSTSGTLGKSKLVCHNLKSLIKTTKPYNESTSKYSWGLLYEHTRFAGIQVLLQSIISGSKLLAPRYNKELKYKIEFFVKNNCTHISATPTLWLKIMLVPKSKNLKLSQITLGGEIVTEKILNSLSNYFPKARIVHIFAITEGGVGFSVSDKKPGFPIKFLKEAPNEVKIKIDNGRLFIKNKDVKSKYLESNISFVDSKGWVGTGDMVLIKNDRVFFLGREKGVINVGGEKVYPDEIENILYSHPDVAIAKVYSKSNPITGSIVVADIEPNNSKLNKNKLKESLLKLAGDNLERHKIPVIFRFVSNIKLNQTGKLQRK